MSESAIKPVAWIDEHGKLVRHIRMLDGGVVGDGRAIPDSWCPLFEASIIINGDAIRAAIGAILRTRNDFTDRGEADRYIAYFSALLECVK